MWRQPEQPDRYLAILTAEPYQLLARLYGTVLEATVAFWGTEGGHPMLAPVTTVSASSPIGLGSDSEPVVASIRGVETYLADSMQFLLEYGCRLTGQTMYYVAPSFRGEHQDRSHLSEFFHSEAEIIGTLGDVMAVVERYVRCLCRSILDQHAPAMARLGINLDHIHEASTMRDAWPRVFFDDAVSSLHSDHRFVTHSADHSWRVLTRAGEQEILRTFGAFVWVTHHDRMAAPFYQATYDLDNRLACTADLLFGLGEVVGAGMRHSSGTAVREALGEHGVDVGPYEWYVRMKDCVPLQTAGFGLGIERFMAWVLHHDDIRDLQVVPRILGHRLLP